MNLLIVPSFVTAGMPYAELRSKTDIDSPFKSCFLSKFKNFWAEILIFMDEIIGLIGIDVLLQNVQFKTNILQIYNNCRETRGLISAPLESSSSSRTGCARDGHSGLHRCLCPRLFVAFHG